MYAKLANVFDLWFLIRMTMNDGPKFISFSMSHSKFCVDSKYLMHHSDKWTVFMQSKFKEFKSIWTLTMIINLIYVSVIYQK